MIGSPSSNLEAGAMSSGQRHMTHRIEYWILCSQHFRAASRLAENNKRSCRHSLATWKCKSMVATHIQLRDFTSHDPRNRIRCYLVFVSLHEPWLPRICPYLVRSLICSCREWQMEVTLFFAQREDEGTWGGMCCTILFAGRNCLQLSFWKLPSTRNVRIREAIVTSEWRKSNSELRQR